MPVAIKGEVLWVYNRRVKLNDFVGWKGVDGLVVEYMRFMLKTTQELLPCNDEQVY